MDKLREKEVAFDLDEFNKSRRKIINKDFLKSTLDAKNMTQQQLSLITGISQTSISKYMTGKSQKFRDDNQYKIAKVLGVHESDLLMYEPSPLELVNSMIAANFNDDIRETIKSTYERLSIPWDYMKYECGLDIDDKDGNDSIKVNFNDKAYTINVNQLNAIARAVNTQAKATIENMLTMME